MDNKGVPQKNPKLSFKAAIVAIVVPMLLQVACVLAISSVDPCNNNAGCMAGSLTAYAAILILPASLVVLIIAAIIERVTGRVDGMKALKINVGLALAPFIVVFGLMIAYM